MDYAVRDTVEYFETADVEVADEMALTPDLMSPVMERFRQSAATAPNKRMHGAVYKTLGAMFIGILTVWAITFRETPSVLFNLSICFVYLAMYLGGPILFARVTGQGVSDDLPLRKFLREPFDTNTGIITGKQAWIQVCIIPGALFICTIGMGIAATIAN